MNVVPSSSAVRHAYREELGPGQRSALLSWLAFSVTFAGLRALTYSIRAGKGPFGNISVGGEHLHHYMWGIGLLSGVGAVAVRGEERHRRHPAVAACYGAGLALIVDEFALLLDLRDVYWARQGRISIDLGVGGIALAGSYFAALPVLRRLRRERKQAAAGGPHSGLPASASARTRGGPVRGETITGQADLPCGPG
jgi:hypothetical protein